VRQYDGLTRILRSLDRDQLDRLADDLESRAEMHERHNEEIGAFGDETDTWPKTLRALVQEIRRLPGRELSRDEARAYLRRYAPWALG